MKKLAILFAALAVCATMTACSENTSSTTEVTTAAVTTATAQETTVAPTTQAATEATTQAVQTTTQAQASDSQSSSSTSSDLEELKNIKSLDEFVKSNYVKNLIKNSENSYMSADVRADDERTLVMEFKLKQEFDSTTMSTMKSSMESYFDSMSSQMQTTAGQINTALGFTDTKIIVRMLDVNGNSLVEKTYTAN